MKRGKRAAIITAAGLASALISGCGHYPAPIKSALSIKWTSRSEYMVVIVNLPLEDWPKLQKFRGLEHFTVSESMASQVTDDYVRALSALQLPKLRQVSFAHCSHVTDEGIQSLTNLPSIAGLQLLGTGITDRGMKASRKTFPI